MTDIGRRTSWLVGYLALSQRVLADRVGVAQTFVSAVARGRSMPSIAMLAGLRREFNVNLNWYVAGEGEPFIAGAPDDITVLVGAAIQADSQHEARIRGFLEALVVVSQPQRRAQAG